MWTPCWNIFLFPPLNICKNHAANLLRSRMQISQGFRLKQDFKRGCITFTLYVPTRTKLIFNISKKEKTRVSALLFVLQHVTKKAKKLQQTSHFHRFSPLACANWVIISSQKKQALLRTLLRQDTDRTRWWCHHSYSGSQKKTRKRIIKDKLKQRGNQTFDFWLFVQRSFMTAQG